MIYPFKTHVSISQSGELEEKETTRENIFYGQKPICIYTDGLNVRDDVGGLSRYLNFFETIRKKYGNRNMICIGNSPKRGLFLYCNGLRYGGTET